MATAASGLERHHIQAHFTGSAGCRDQCNQIEVPSFFGDDDKVDDTRCGQFLRGGDCGQFGPNTKSDA